MNRRDTITAMAVLGACAPLGGFAQPTKTNRVGIIFGVAEEVAKPAYENILAGLRDYGYVPGKNVIVHARYSGGDPSRMPALADEMIALKVDVVLTFDTPAAVLRQKTTTLPIVLFTSVDPVAAGLAQSFARPGTNVTGMSAMYDQTIPKYIELLLEVVPKMSRFAVLYDDSISLPAQEMHLRMARTAAQSKSLTVIPVKWSKPDELRAAFDTIKKARPDALLLIPTNKGFVHMRDIAAEVRRLRVPSVGALFGRFFQESGTLLSFSTNTLKQARRALRYVDQILKGANPAELPIEQYGIYDLEVNLAIARELGLKVPRSILVRAERVIE